jgi:hypothetical protein
MINIAKSILKAQKEMGAASKDAKNPFFKSKFADLNSVRDAVMPALHSAGISVLQPTVFRDGRSFVQTCLLHESGETFTAETEIICAKQNDPQALGSAISYARRYGLQALMCVAAVDDDAEAGMGRTTSTIETKTLTPEIKSVGIAKGSTTTVTLNPEVKVSETATVKKITVPSPFKVKTKTTGASPNDGI